MNITSNFPCSFSLSSWYSLGQNLTLGSTATGPGQYIATSPNPAAAAAYQAAAGIPAAAYATQHPGIMSPFTTGE